MYNVLCVQCIPPSFHLPLFIGLVGHFSEGIFFLKLNLIWSSHNDAQNRSFEKLKIKLYFFLCKNKASMSRGRWILERLVSNWITYMSCIIRCVFFKTTYSYTQKTWVVILTMKKWNGREDKKSKKFWWK